MPENIYFVDKNDIPTGEIAEKLSAHNSNTKLHAAFSSYIFDSTGKFLVTQRAHTKKVWHGVWTNSCCGHPKPGESRESAVKRRLQYELGLTISQLQLVVPDYIYKTPPYGGIIEHEFCPIYVGIAESDVVINPNEVEDYKWVGWDWYKNQLEKDSDDYNVFAKNISDYSKLTDELVPKWSWWAKDQLSYLQNSDEFKEFLRRINSK